MAQFGGYVLSNQHRNVTIPYDGRTKNCNWIIYAFKVFKLSKQNDSKEKTMYYFVRSFFLSYLFDPSYIA